MSDRFRSAIERPFLRYAITIVAVAVSFLLRYALVQGLGLEMPTFITFFPAVMLVAVLGGLWPGLLATALIVLGTDYLILPPVGHFAIARVSDFVALSLFAAMGALMSLLAELYRRSQRTIATYKAEQALWVSNQKLEVALASMTDAVFITDISGEFIQFNDAFVAFHKFRNRADCPRKLSECKDFLEIKTADGELLPPEMWSVRRALRGETGTNIEYTLHRKDTGESWVGSYSFSPLRDSQDAIIGSVVVARDITDLKVAEQKLRDSERDLSLMYQNIHDVIFYLAVEPGGQFRFISVNPAFLHATGLEMAQVVGKLAQEVIPEPSSGKALKKYKEAVLGRKTIFWEEISAYPAGEKYAEVFVSPVFDARGVCTNLIGVLHDITERRQAEKHVERLNRVYAVLSDINQAIVRVKDSQAMLEAACRIAVEKGKFHMAWIGMIDPATQALNPVASSGMVDGYLDKLKINLLDPDTAGGPAAQCILSGKHAICADIEHDPFYLPWRDEAIRRGYRSSAGFPLAVDGHVVGVFSIYANDPKLFAEDELALLDEMAMDISFALEFNRLEEGRRRAEEELRWRTAFFEAQVDSALDGILVVDGQGKKILQNHRLNEIMNIPDDVSGSLDDARQRQYVSTIVKNPDEFNEKVNYLNSHPDEISRDEIELLDGTILDRYSSPVRDKAGNYYGRIWTFRDITERRQLEGEFRQAQKMEAIGQLTGGIAHNFNNLLTVILGCSEVIGEEVKENTHLSKMAKLIADAARRGAELTHRMLAFARLQPLQARPVNVNQLLDGMQNFLRRTLSEQIELHLIKGCANCDALVDPTQLESALLNLCVNARDALPQGGTITIETGNAVLDADYAEQNPDVTPGQYVFIAVSDNGFGICHEYLDRVFDPFFTTKGVGKGTGLGLSMVYGFIKQSQGHVKIYSEAGHGTLVKLYLPVAKQESESPGENQTSVVDLQGSEVILLVEDNESVREFARSQLITLGYQVLEAASGKDALKVLSEHADVQLLFTDIVMPGGLNGRELGTEACRVNPKLKVLYCSGYAENAILHEGLLDKDVQFLSKPYTRRQLAARIREVLGAS